MKLSFGNSAVCALVLVLQGCGGGGGTDTTSGSTAGSGSVPAANLPTTIPVPVPAAPTTLAVESAAYLTAVTAANSVVSGTLLENFETAGILGGAPTGWIYEPGAEFPGARGGLTLRAGQASPSMAAMLSADLNCSATTLQLTATSGCGKYVSMTRRLGSLYSTSTPSTAAVALTVQTSSALLTTGMRVVDGTGQVLQFSFSPRNLETAAGATWAKVLVPVGESASHWSGANDGQLSGGISAVSLLASTPNIATPAADLKVDELRFVDSGVGSMALSRQSPLLTDGVLPSMNGRLAISTHFYQTSDNELSQAASIGISTVRIDLFWRLVEVGGRFDFSGYDTILKRMAKYGQSALFILDYGHPDHGGGGAPLTDADRAAYAEFARQAAVYFKGRNVVGFEIWNEPDNSNFWTQGTPETYAQLLGQARTAIKAADSTRKVINGGPSWVNLPYIMKLAKTGKLNNLDGFAIHPYRPWAPETFAADVAPIKEILVSQGMTKPTIWTTEWGYSSTLFDPAIYGNGQDIRARSRQAVMILRTVLTENALNLPLMTLYELSDSGVDPTDGEQNFGLLTQAGVAKPSFNALKTLYSFTKTRNYVGLVKNVPANTHAMRWDGTNDSVFAVWVDSTAASLTLTLPKAATVTSWSGAAIATTTTANSATSQLKVTEAMGPVFVMFPITVTQ